MTKFPKYLKKGDSIGIMCPAGYMDRKNINACIETLKARGYKIVIGKTVGSKSKNYFSAPDEMRCKELQEMLDNENLQAILFARGGYGSSRIIDNLDFSRFIKNPKWLMGFSDITVIHNHVLRNFNIASLHSSMASAFARGSKMSESVNSMLLAISGERAKYQCPAHKLNKAGIVTGKLIGGNLAILAHIIGTKSEPKTAGKILFMEDVGEYIYNIDRMIIQLKRSGKLEKIKGLIIGGFTETKDTERPFGKSAEETIADAVKNLKIPIAFGFPVSHGKENVALKQGGKYKLTISKKETLLEEVIRP